MFFLTIHDAVLHILLKKDIASSPKLKLAEVTLQFPSSATSVPSHYSQAPSSAPYSKPRALHHHCIQKAND